MYPGTKVTLLTMGPARAAEIVREGLYRGADDGVVLSDRAFAGSDTLATSYALSAAVRFSLFEIFSDISCCPCSIFSRDSVGAYFAQS